MNYGENTARVYDSAMSAPPAPSPAIATVVESLERELLALHEYVNTLEKRLEPALGPPRPEAAGVDQIKDQAASPHVRKLRELLIGVTQARAKIEGLLRRVEF
jgi:hypothetical protein